MSTINLHLDVISVITLIRGKHLSRQFWQLLILQTISISYATKAIFFEKVNQTTILQSWSSNRHCVKRVRKRSFSVLNVSPCGLNNDHNKSEYGHFPRSVIVVPGLLCQSSDSKSSSNFSAVICLFEVNNGNIRTNLWNLTKVTTNTPSQTKSLTLFWLFYCYSLFIVYWLLYRTPQVFLVFPMVAINK